VTNGKDYTVVMGDRNAVVGETREENVVGEYGLCSRNKRGENMKDFCSNQKMYVTNTWLYRRRRYTWSRP